MVANQHKRCNSARVLRSIQTRPGASTSPAHSRASASQFKGNNLPGTAAFILRCVAFIRCREHKPELKTQTQIRQGSPASSAAPQSVPGVAAHNHDLNVAAHNRDFNRSLPPGAGKSVLESRVATRPHHASQGGEDRFVGASLKQNTVELPQTSMSCWLGFHYPLVNASDPPWSCWRGNPLPSCICLSSQACWHAELTASQAQSIKLSK